MLSLSILQIIVVKAQYFLVGWGTNMEHGFSQILRWIVVIVSLAILLVGMVVTLTPDGLALIDFKNGLIVRSPLLEIWNLSDVHPCS